VAVGCTAAGTTVGSEASVETDTVGVDWQAASNKAVPSKERNIRFILMNSILHQKKQPRENPRAASDL
jgi:hypothetical protein